MEMTKSELRLIIHDENRKANNVLKRDLKDVFMTKGQCLTIHQRVGVKTNGELSKEKAKFWGAMAGLITAISGVMVIGITYLVQRFK